MANQKKVRLFDKIRTALRRRAVVAEPAAIPAGAAAAVVDFNLAKAPIAEANGIEVGGDGNSSLVLTSTAFTNEVAAGTPDADLANGDFWVDYFTGLGRGRKADTSTSATATYAVLTPFDSNSYTAYEAQQFTITGAQSDYDVATQESMFVNDALEVSIISSIDCSFKLNSASNDSIPLLAGQERVIGKFDISNLFITTTADTDIEIIAFR